MSTLRCPALALAVLAFVATAFSQATTYTWTGDAAMVYGNIGSASATDAANWAGGSAPVSSRDNTTLSFGASARLNTDGLLNLALPAEFEVFRLTFNAPLPFYQIGTYYGRLGLGAGGLALNGSESNAVSLYSDLNLISSQTWAINGSAYVYGRITEDSPLAKLTKTGAGSLYLYNDSSTFTGGVDVQAGTLFLGGGSGFEGGTVFSGPVGTGTLTLRDNTALRTSSSWDITLHNAIQLGTNVTFGDRSESRDLTLAGNITPLNSSTTILLGAEGATFFTGNIGNALVEGQTAPTAIRFKTPASDDDSLGFAVLRGTNTYSGGTIADRAAVIFYTPGSIPEVGDIAAYNGGYISTGYNHLAPGANGVGGMTTLLSHITDPSSFNGSLGFDTDPDESEGPTTFYDALNLSAFAPDGSDPQAGFWGLGSQTSAIITGRITPPNGGNFVFGGGEGKLYVQSNLGESHSAESPANPNAMPAPVGVRVRSVYGERPLTVWLQGNNSYTGNLMSDHSIVVLDSPNALPTGSHFSLDAQGYVGFTERFTAGSDSTASPAEFIARLLPGGYTSTSVLGFDSYSSDGRTIFNAIDLSALNNLYLGTTTRAHLAGPIRAPSSGQLSIAGIDGGWLTLDTALTPTVVIGENPPVSGVTSLQVGMSGGADTFRRGIVELTNSGSTYSGGTDFRSGYLLVGASSTGTANAPTAGPLGTGTLTFKGQTSWTPTVLVASSENITLHNAIAFDAGAMAQFGVDNFQSQFDDRDPGYRLANYMGNGFTLAGNLSGTPNQILFTGSGTHTLSGNNSTLSAQEISIGRATYVDNPNNNVTGGGSRYGSSYTTPLLVVASDNALGATNSLVRLSNGADLRFTTTAPVIGSIMGGEPIYYDGVSDRSYISLAAGSTLTINQHQNGLLGANIGGAVSDRYDPYATLASVNATLIKNGNGTLSLTGQSTFSGGLIVNGGMVVAASNTNVGPEGNLISGPLGTGTVTLAGGRLDLQEGADIHNPIVFSGNGNVLSGNGTFNTAIAVGTGVTLAPGNSPGTLTFTNGLTWAAGGTYSLDIAQLAFSTNFISDTLIVSGGAFDVTADAQNRFTIHLTPLETLDAGIGLMGGDPTETFSLIILQTNSSLAGLFGPNGSFDYLQLETDAFTSVQPGTFSFSLGNEDTALVLNFTPTTVPEPSTYALLGAGLLVIGYAVRRRRQRA